MAARNELSIVVNDKFKGVIGPDILTQLVTIINQYAVKKLPSLVSLAIPPKKHEKVTVQALGRLNTRQAPSPKKIHK